MKRLALAAAMLLTACIFESDKRLTGGGSETEYIQVAGTVTVPHGHAAGARVRIRPAAWVHDPELPPGPGVKDTLTDGKGRFAFKGLPKGEYRLECAGDEGMGYSALVAVDTAYPDTSSRLPRIDAVLEPPGSLGMILADPRPGVDYFLQVEGMQRRILADGAGRMAVGLPQGTYNLRIVASPKVTLPAVFEGIRIRTDAHDSLPGIVLPTADGGGVPFIFDSNIGFAADDAAALTLLHALQTKGEIRLIATGTTNPSRPSPAVLDIINTHHGRGDIPVGAWKGGKPADRTGYDSALAASGLPHDLPAWDSLPTAAAAYARALESQPDSSVVMFCSGDVRNAWDLMRKSPALAARKIRRLVLVGGQFPAGKEFNFAASIARDTLPNMIRQVVEGWPGPIHFAGNQTGGDMACGACLATAATGGPLKRIYDMEIGSPNPIRPSTDLFGALYAVRGPQPLWDVVSGGTMAIADDGSNVWTEGSGSRLAYVARKGGPEAVASVLDSLLCALPKP